LFSGSPFPGVEQGQEETGRVVIGGTLTFWTIPRDIWIDIHDWAAVALLVVVIIHVILHWQWIVHMSKSLVKRAP